MALKTGRKKTGGSPVKRTAMVNFPDMSAGQRRFYMDIIRTLASELEIQDWQAEAAVKLIDDGNTIPFISRYRKEATGALNDEVLRKLFERLNYLRNLEEK